MDYAKKTMLIMVGVLVLLVVATFVLPVADAAFEKDVIGLKHYESLLKIKFGSNYSSAMLQDESITGLVTNKTVISNPVLEEALAMYGNSKGLLSCVETCYIAECSYPCSCISSKNMCLYTS